MLNMLKHDHFDNKPQVRDHRPLVIRDLPHECFKDGLTKIIIYSCLDILSQVFICSTFNISLE